MKNKTEPEIKPIDYQDCENALLMMWILKVVSDSEYFKLSDKLEKMKEKK